MSVIMKNLLFHLVIPFLITWVWYLDGATASVVTVFGELSPFASLLLWWSLLSFCARGFIRCLNELLSTNV